MRPTPEQLQGLDVLVFDIQDIGARFYTYLATMAMALEEAKTAGVDFIVLDRPNPIRATSSRGRYSPIRTCVSSRRRPISRSRPPRPHRRRDGAVA